jgi:hypothetical protein
VSYLHVQALESVHSEFTSSAAVLAYATRVWHELSREPELHGARHIDFRRAVDNLETTYIIRLFAEYEAILQDHLSARHPGIRMPRTAEALINRVALRERLPHPVREDAQAVREYRNALVHRRITPVPSRSLREVRAVLNRFLARLP